MRYLVRCGRCDRAFWQESRAAPVAAHAAWDRAAGARRDEAGWCSGGGLPGYWIGEAEGEGAAPLTHRPNAPGGPATA